MTHLFLLFMTFWSISISFAQDGNSASLSCMKTAQDIEKSLKISHFNCTAKTINNCTYKECLGTLPSYPRPVLVVIPLLTDGLRLHFHGHKLGKFPEYEKNLSSMVKSFGLNAELCKSRQVTVFPESDGNCATFDQKLKTKQNFENFFKELHLATGDYLKQAPLSISAHSGGGRTISRLLDFGFEVKQVSIFDGIYSETQKNSLKNWYLKSDGQLILATVKGMSPETFSQALKKELPTKITNSKATIKGTSFDVSKSDRFIHYSRAAGQAGSLKAHYDVLSQTWPGTY
jgi:hypothetical protein